MKLNTYAVVKHNINTNKYPTEYLFRVKRGTKLKGNVYDAQRILDNVVLYNNGLPF